ncbi:MAG TPA: SDR family oxidoreductase [Gemmatimonadaceae bacterium]|nr:SDR family oxidoreductase [Gemmatimonadaceae bacterium]
MIDLSGRVALVTGSSRGIGRACAIRLAEAGADVIINYVTSHSAADEVARQVAALGRRTAIVKADVSEQSDIIAMVSFVRDAFGALDILVSNAATGGFRPLLATTARQFEAAMNTNVRALVFLVQAALPLLEQRQGRARVIAISSHGSHLALPMYGLIGSTKAALESLIRHFAFELGKRGINLNVVQAGLVETDSTRAIPDHEALFARARARTLARDCQVDAGDVADAVVYLSSDLSAMVQGHVLVVDGGASIHA